MKELYGTDSMGQTAENVAELHGISRADQDAFALLVAAEGGGGARRRAAGARRSRPC